MKNLIQEIHGRSMWQVAGLYAAFSWLVLQISQTLTEGLGLPEWVVPFALILLAVGLPIVLATAYLQKGLRTRKPEPVPQSLADVGELDPGLPIPVTGAARHWTWKRAMLGGAGAFALFALVGIAWAIMRGLGIGPAGTLVAKGLLEERDVILLADFENSSDDPTLGEVVTEALRVDLSQSEAVRLADAAFVSGALARMERPDETDLAEDVARELAQREGLKALVVGDVARAGSGYVLSARVVTPGEGEILVSHRESARGDQDLLDAIDALSRRVRERIGDPLGSLATSPALERVTTANLAALRAYSQAVRLPEAHAQRQIALLEEATERDSTFAMAWNALGILLSNFGVEPGRVMDARTRAFELRDRLTERERNATASMFYMGVTNEPRQAIPFLEAMIEADPASYAAVNNLGEAYRNLGELDRALELYHRAVAIDSANSAIPLMNIAQVEATRGNVEGVNAAAALLDVYGPGPWGDWHRSLGPQIAHDYAAVSPYVEAARDSVPGSTFILAQVSQWLGNVAAIRGRLEESARYWNEASTLQEQNGSAVEALRNQIALAVSEALARGERGRAALDAALERYPFAEMDPVERPYLDVAEAYALLGFPDEARSLVEEFEALAPEPFQYGMRYRRHMVEGEIALSSGHVDEAIAEFRQGAYRPQELDPMAQLARAFDASGQADSAKVHYRRFLDGSHFLSMIPHAKFLARALERLAELEYEAGDLPAAARYYAEFLELWAEADAELGPRLQAAQAKLQEIYDEIG